MFVVVVVLVVVVVVVAIVDVESELTVDLDPLTSRNYTCDKVSIIYRQDEYQVESSSEHE